MKPPTMQCLSFVNSHQEIYTVEAQNVHHRSILWKCNWKRKSLHFTTVSHKENVNDPSWLFSTKHHQSSSCRINKCFCVWWNGEATRTHSFCNEFIDLHHVVAKDEAELLGGRQKVHLDQVSILHVGVQLDWGTEVWMVCEDLVPCIHYDHLGRFIVQGQHPKRLIESNRSGGSFDGQQLFGWLAPGLAMKLDPFTATRNLMGRYPKHPVLRQGSDHMHICGILHIKGEVWTRKGLQFNLELMFASHSLLE